MKIDLGCGKNKKEGFIGVDSLPFPGVDVVLNVGTDPWPWVDGSVEEAHASHLVEHLTREQRAHFFNELYRVLKPKGTATIITPFADSRATGDLTHEWPPVREMFWLYLHREWRKQNAPHLDADELKAIGKPSPLALSCDFDAGYGYTPHPELAVRNQEYVMFAMSHYREMAQDMMGTLTKRA